MSKIILNRQQKEAVKHNQGPLLVIAGAGTGKTTVITERVKRLISKDLAKPAEILSLTFTEKAAREMEERIDIALPYGYVQMWISTFHAFCDRVLRAEAVHIGLNPDFHLLTEAESIVFLRHHLFDLDLDYFRPHGNPTKFLQALLTHFNRLKDEDITPE
jgi:DNA helicase-2/ATP-dependent DNA helicase PcrA